MSSAARRRLVRDFKRLQSDSPSGVTAAPNDNNILSWQAIIFGPDDTSWEGGTFKLELTFTEDYPNKAPAVRFTTRIFHPNIYNDGQICLDILQNQWSPIYDISAILTSIQSLLSDPNPASPANSEASSSSARTGATLATTRALEPMPYLVARDCRVELAAPTLQRGAAVGDINGVETHCLCCKFGDCSTIFFTQNGGVGAVVARRRWRARRWARGDDGLADLLARKLSARRPAHRAHARRAIAETIADVALVALLSARVAPDYRGQPREGRGELREAPAAASRSAGGADRSRGERGGGGDAPSAERASAARATKTPSP
ncbi:hypothetical protein JL722_13880 [Aureococcus anophagefferens]|nr:hypothetical protein JL722_13880 [Aureococcus anophagefferens]